MSDTNPTRVDAMFMRLKNHRVLAIVIAIGVCIIAISSFTGAISQLWNTIVAAVSRDGSLSKEDIVLCAKWDWGGNYRGEITKAPIFREEETIGHGQTIKGKLDPGTRIQISLRNQSQYIGKNFLVEILGNVDTRATPSESFHAQEGLPRNARQIWKSKPAVQLDPFPSGFDSRAEALALTALHLGAFSWGGRAEGGFSLRIVVSATGMTEPAEFYVSLEPHVGFEER